MALTITDSDRFETVASRFGTVNGKVSFTRNTGGLVLELEVIGTHFPALSVNRDEQSSQFNLKSISANEVRINYNDGTGWHDYNLTAYQSGYNLSFVRKSNNSIGVAPTPQNISRTEPYDAPVYFYEDLPLPTGTVDDFYNHPRKIQIDIKNFADITLFNTYFLGLYGNLPPTINRFRNIETLTIQYAYKLTGVSVELTKVFCTTLGFRLLGFELGNEVPQWMLNSNSIETLDMWDMFDFSGQTAVTSRLTELFDGVNLPNLTNVSLRDTGIDFQFPNIYNPITVLNLNDNTSPNFKLSPDLTSYKDIRLELQTTKMAASEYERVLSGSNTPSSISISSAIQQQLTLTTQNTNTAKILLGGLQSFGGSFPTFLVDMTVVEDVTFLVHANNTTYAGITSWGTAGISNSVINLIVENQIGLPSTLPTWFSTLINLKNLTLGFCETQTREDAMVASFYGIVEANASKASGNTQFREMTVRFLASALNRNNSPRPTGTYQQPAGYIQGSNNGTPATSMEMIWVLVHQYDMIVSVLNVTGDGIDIYTP